MELTDVWNKGWELWDKHGLLFLFVISVVFILVMAIVRRNETGSYYKYDIQRTSDKTRRAPSTDSKGEVECRRVLEKLTGVSFGKDRSEKMRNNVTGHDLELDCVNYDLRLACEYQGRQHYEFVPFFHRNKEHFMNQKYRDEMKRMMCKQQGIRLIEVPYTVKIQDIHEYITKELKRLGFRTV